MTFGLLVTSIVAAAVGDAQGDEWGISHYRLKPGT
jgi:hypothetical protein